MITEAILNLVPNAKFIISGNFTYDDIYTALSSLGYRKNQIDKAIKQLTKENSFEGNIEDVIKKVLSIIR